MKDSIVESVRQDLLDRSELGIKKYNTTLDREDLSAGEWLIHAYEEMLDGALYLKRLHKEWGKTQIYVLAEDYLKMEKEFYHVSNVNADLDDINADLNAELRIKNNIIENLTKVIKSQEEEIKELQKENHNKTKRAWHY
jgi:DNA repair exonuclease SbcCD ATPase subunit